MKHFIKNIFSIQKSSYFTIYTVLGVKIKYSSKFNKLNRRIDELHQQLQAYEYMQNFFVDIEKLPKAKGTLRKFQQIQATFLNILHIALKKHDLPYWVDFGTLLGTVRHQGFIPWDDDLDISMLREDYTRFPEIFEKEIAPHGFSIRLDSAIKIFWELEDNKKFFLCDVYPYDTYFKVLNNNEERKQLDHKNRQCYNEFLKIFNLNESRKFFNKYTQHNFDKIQEQIRSLRNKIVLEGKKEISHGDIFTGAEILPYGHSNNFSFNTIFPLNELYFEGKKVSVPNHFDTYLTTLYGDYWQLPKNSARNHLTEAMDLKEKTKGLDLDILLQNIQLIEKEINTKS